VVQEIQVIPVNRVIRVTLGVVGVGVILEIREIPEERGTPVRLVALAVLLDKFFPVVLVVMRVAVMQVILVVPEILVIQEIPVVREVEEVTETLVTRVNQAAVEYLETKVTLVYREMLVKTVILETRVPAVLEVPVAVAVAEEGPTPTVNMVELAGLAELEQIQVVIQPNRVPKVL
jgi:hypothetical protein